MILSGLAIFAGLSVNLVLQFGLGSGAAGKTKALPLFQIFCLFLSVVLLWLIYTYILAFVSQEFMVYFLFFPLSVFMSFGLEKLEKFIFPESKQIRLFSYKTGYEGLIPASLVLTVNLALNFSDALILSFFFATGCLLAVIFMKEIRRRSNLEKAPEYFRGLPLAFVSMGLLSMIFGTAAWIFFRVLDGF